MLRKASTGTLSWTTTRTTLGSWRWERGQWMGELDRTWAKRTLSSSSNDWKGNIKNLLERTSTRASELAKEQTNRTLERLENQGKEAFKVISSKAQKTSKALGVEAQKAYEKGATSAKDTMRKTSQQASETLQSAVSQTSQALTQTSKAATEAASERIKTSSLNVVVQARAFGAKAIRWTALWSLAAIFVYGVATSIPTALIRHAFSGKDDTQKTEPTLVVEAPLTETRKRWWA